ncbi:MAG: protoporphyrinogen oxidase [Ilumatobacteraceae bacterium]
MRVAVVGGGIAGLSAVHALVAGEHAPQPQVVLFEAGDHLGGKIRTTPFAGIPAVDEGADAFLARVPWATALAREVGLGETLTSPQSGKAAVWFDAMHDIPEGLLLGMPTDLLALSRSHLLSWRGKLRAATEPLRRQTSLAPDSLGAYVRDRFGEEVHERLVDPLVGSIYAADTDRFSLAAVPQIAELAGRSRSVLLAARTRPPAPTGPVFYSPTGGMGALVAALAGEATARGVEIRTSASVTELAADGRAWRVDGEPFDAVVLACPAKPATKLLAGGAAGSASTLSAIPTADVVLVAVTVAAAGWPERLTGRSGYLVPKPRQRLVTAVSFGSQKWAHWQVPGKVVLRISLGRDGLPVLQLTDDDLVAAAVDDASRHLGVDLQPGDVRISRFPAAFPQYRPHHGERIAAADAALPPGIAIAGASYHGIGIPACIRSGTEAAGRVLSHLGVLPE